MRQLVALMNKYGITDFAYSERAYKTAKSFKSFHASSTYFSIRRLENGGWLKVFATYTRAEYARVRGKKYDPE